MANGLPRESIGYYTGLGQRILVELNPNILVQDAIIMGNAANLGMGKWRKDQERRRGRREQKLAWGGRKLILL